MVWKFSSRSTASAGASPSTIGPFASQSRRNSPASTTNTFTCATRSRLNPAWSLCKFSPTETARAFIEVQLSLSSATTSVSSLGTLTSYLANRPYTSSMGFMMESISDSLTRMSCWMAITCRTSSRSSILRLSWRVVSFMYWTMVSSWSLPCAWRFLANCFFHVAASALRETLSGWVSRESAPMLCTGAILPMCCSMSMYFCSSVSNMSMLGFLAMNASYATWRSWR